MAPLCPLSVLSLLLFTTLLASAEPPPPFLLPLIHVLSRAPGNATTHPNHHLHLLKSASLRSAARLRHHRGRGHRLQQQHRQVSLPLSPGSDYTLTFSVGSREAHPVELYMDTGSDLVWFPCAPFECILCEGKPNYPPPPGSTLFPTAAPIPCHSPSCSAAHSSLPSSDLCVMAGCPLETIETSTCSAFPCPPFYYAYGDGSLIGRLRHDHLAIPAGAVNSLQLPNFTFGCAHTALAEPIGVAGFGRGLLSLPAQLARLSPHLGRQFSYCLVSHSFEAQRLHLPSPLILGRSDASRGAEEPFVYTPMLRNPKHPYFYTVALDAVSVGGRRIPASPELRRVDRHGNGGIVVDSGTTFTMLPAVLYAQIADEFDRRMTRGGRKRASEAEAETGLAPCYHEHAAGNSSSLSGLPSVALHFAGNTSVALPRRNYFMSFSSGGKKVECLMLMGSDGSDDEDSGGPAGTLGNFQQQGFEVVYDLDGRRVGFARRRCAALWDSLSRG
ncbi:hypothetical protein Taro_042643 [Colocasia esculenta]|uniref:Peptidase A1 domain-containing protein n=1 Tax=Colocasia esculenta TaxID=4460 RepID=A0A843WPF8_COLES|nr:hypothetical protein [Colocasia esculenta]